MNQLVTISAAPHAPALVTTAGPEAETRFWGFFAANIRNKHTRRADALTVREFLASRESVAGVASIVDVRPLHVGVETIALFRCKSPLQN